MRPATGQQARVDALLARASRRPASGSRARRPRARSRACASARAARGPTRSVRIAASYAGAVTPNAPMMVQLLHHDQVADEVGHRLEALDAGEHDAAAVRDVVQRLRDRLRSRWPTPRPPRRRRGRRSARCTRRRTSSCSTSITWSAPSSRASASLAASRVEPGDDDACRRRRRAPRSRWRGRAGPGRGSARCRRGRCRGSSTAQRKPAPSGLNITAMLAGRSARIWCTIEHGSRYM